MSNLIQTTALTVLSGGVLTLASLVSGNVAEAHGYTSGTYQSETEQVKEIQNRARDKGRAAHQSIQSGGSASPTKDGYGSMSKGEKEAYKAGFRGE